MDPVLRPTVMDPESSLESIHIFRIPFMAHVEAVLQAGLTGLDSGG